MNDQGGTVVRAFRPSRRRLVLGGGLIGGALVVGYALKNRTRMAGMALGLGADDPPAGAFGPYVRIGPDGWVVIVNPYLEMGQGTHAGLAAMVAEELDADWDRVRIEAAPADMRVYGFEGTASSSAIAASWDRLRLAGAAARAMFVDAAALRWNVAARLIRVENGIVLQPESGRRATFAELAAEAATRTPPARPVLKDPREYRLIGTDRVRCKDSLAKSTGATRYTQDVHLPGMLTAMVAHAPRFGGVVAGFTDDEARKVRGVVDVFRIPSGVAVVAEDTHAARKGRDALKIDWDDSRAERRSTGQLMEHFHAIAAGNSDLKPTVFQSKGVAATAFDDATFAARYDFPYLAHAPMEPMNCVAQVDGWTVRLISASQMPTLDQIRAARTVLTLPGKVAIDVLPAGGSFGRRGVAASDYMVECLRIALHVGGRPVKLVWTREDDMCGGYYRPMAHHSLQVRLGEDGFPSAWRHRIVAQALSGSGANPSAVEGVKDSPYFASAAVVDAQVYTPDIAVPVGFWRSVGHSHTAMAMEHTVDRLAALAGRDPAAYRRTLYRRAGDARRLGVLDLVTEKAGWGRPMDAGWARGLAVHACFGTAVAQIAEVALIDGRPRVRRVVCAVDCGIAVAPDQIAAQMEGAVCFGLSAALHGAVTLTDGAVEQTNFDGYQVLRMDEAPVVETHIVPSTRRPTGMGEPGTPPIAPATANAILALTGAAANSLPFVTA